MGILALTKSLRHRTPAPPPEATARSPHWEAVRRAFLKKCPNCAACGKGRVLGLRKIDVHHIQPFHVRPDLELDESNLITLCRPHHFEIGHLGDWQKWNVNVVADAAAFDKHLRRS